MHGKYRNVRKCTEICEELQPVGWRFSGLANDKAVPRCLDDLDRDYLGVVDA
jgi:hypothetical protein